MKPFTLSTIASSILFSFAMATSAAAQDSGAAPSAIPPVQAPPALDDPGNPASKTVVLPTPEAQAKTAVIDAQGAAPTPPAEKPPESPGLPDDVQAAANAAELPVVTVRQQGTDTVEEYRKHGKLVFVRVLTNNGPVRYYVDNPRDLPPNMQQLSGPSGVVQPVYYKLFEWK